MAANDLGQPFGPAKNGRVRSPIPPHGAGQLRTRRARREVSPGRVRRDRLAGQEQRVAGSNPVASTIFCNEPFGQNVEGLSHFTDKSCVVESEVQTDTGFWRVSFVRRRKSLVWQGNCRFKQPSSFAAIVGSPGPTRSSFAPSPDCALVAKVDEWAAVGGTHDAGGCEGLPKR